MPKNCTLHLSLCLKILPEALRQTNTIWVLMKKLKGKARQSWVIKLIFRKMQENDTKDSTLTLQTHMYVAVSLQPHSPPFFYPTSLRHPRAETCRHVPEHFIFSLRATFEMKLLKNFLIGLRGLSHCTLRNFQVTFSSFLMLITSKIFDIDLLMN